MPYATAIQTRVSLQNEAANIYFITLAPFSARIEARGRARRLL